MAKKEKIQIQRDKRMEPIDNELDAAMGLLDDRNRQITDLLASFTPPDPSLVDEAEPPVEGEPKAAAEGESEAAKPSKEEDSAPGAE